MTSISRLDRLLAQLRQQLQKRAGAPMVPNRPSQPPEPRSGSGPDPVQGVRALKAAGVDDERVLVAALVEGLLKQELGDGLANAAEFHQTIAVVAAILADDAETWALCRDCVEAA